MRNITAKKYAVWLCEIGRWCGSPRSSHSRTVAFTLNSLKSTHIVLAVVVNISKALAI